MIRSRYRMYGNRLVILLTVPAHPALATPRRSSVRLALDGNSIGAVERLTGTLTSRAGRELVEDPTGMIRLIAGRSLDPSTR